MSEVLTEMIQALRLEVAEIRKRGGDKRVELRDGERLGQSAGYWLYRFLLTEELNLRDETPVRVISGKQEASGILVSFRDGALTLALEKDLGARIDAAWLVADDAFLLERLCEKLDDVRNSRTPFHTSAADRVLGLASIHSGEAQPHRAVLAGGGCNKEQIFAVRRSLGSDATFVWGPPGTGKTATLARLIEAHYHAGRSILLVSNTNIAVDTALERVCERLEQQPEFDHGLVVRLGPAVKDELRRRYGPQVILEEVVARLGKALRQEMEHLSAEAEKLGAERASLIEALSRFQLLRERQAKLASCERALGVASREAHEKGAEADTHRARAARIRGELARVRSMGRLRRFFLGLDPEGLERQAAAADAAADEAQRAARALLGRVEQLEAEIASLRREVTRLAKETQRHPHESTLRSRLPALEKRLEAIRERMVSLDGMLAALEQQVLDRCRIMATTVYRAYLGRQVSRQFDVVVIDEASMLMPPLVYYAAGLATRSVTVAGDFRQLPPIVLSEGELARRWLKRDVFDVCGIPRQLAKKPPDHLVILRTQYRMREPICALVNGLFYRDYPLVSDPSVRVHGTKFPLGPAPLLHVDTTKWRPWAAYRFGGFSRYNLFHALLARNVVCHLVATGYLPPDGPNEDVGVVAPYAAQARLIQALLDERLGRRAAGIAATVHRFQGNEKRAMLIDLTDSTGVPIGMFLKATRLEEDGARLLNVALSRARHHVLLLGNFEYLRAKAPQDSFVRRLVDHFEAHGERLEVEHLLPLAVDDWVGALNRLFPANAAFPENAWGAFNGQSFYLAFRSDLLRAVSSVTIFSPRVTQAGTRRWADDMRGALFRGVRFLIVTQPPEEQTLERADAEAVIEELRKLGANVELRRRLHEKLAIIDGLTLWHGSLDILSHRDTTESMLRIRSPGLCEHLTRFLNLPAQGRLSASREPQGENPRCPKCGSNTARRTGRYGAWFKCERLGCDGKVSGSRRGRSEGADLCRE